MGIPGSLEINRENLIELQSKISDDNVSTKQKEKDTRKNTTDNLSITLNEDLNRSDVRSDPATGVIKDGSVLNLTFRVSQSNNSGCTPLAGARVEIWHCDASGVYSGVRDPGSNTVGQKFLRGHQITDANGQATFITIYPGWYSGRTVHIHFKVRHDDSPQSLVFTSQLFFEDSLSDQVYSNEPYSSKGRRDTLNSRDRIYKEQLLLNVIQTNNSYAATFDISL